MLYEVITAEQYIVIWRCGQSDTDNEGGKSKTRVPEHCVERRLKALRNEHKQDVRQDQHGIELMQEVGMFPSRGGCQKTLQAHVDEDDDQQKGNAFLGGNKGVEVGRAHGFVCGFGLDARITSYNVCYTKLLRTPVLNQVKGKYRSNMEFKI